MDNKWTMFKNYMHNELGITKEDIRTWIKEEVEVQAKAVIANESSYFSPADVLKREAKLALKEKYPKSLKEYVAIELAKDFLITTKTAKGNEVPFEK